MASSARRFEEATVIIDDHAAAAAGTSSDNTRCRSGAASETIPRRHAHHSHRHLNALVS
jgi:hypothetical protein